MSVGPDEAGFDARLAQEEKRWRERRRAHARPLRLAALALLLLAMAAGALFAWHKLRYDGPLDGALASVDGTPVTEADVAAEARAAGVPSKSRLLLVDRVIERRLLAAAADAQGIAADPTFRAERARADEMIAAGALARRFAIGGERVSDADARRFMADHPAAFIGRERITLDGITADLRGVPAATLQWTDTLGDVARELTARRIMFERRVQELDSRALPPAFALALPRIPTGKLFILPLGEVSLAGVITARAPNPTPDTEALETARDAVEAKRAQARVDEAIKRMRAHARIRYAPGLNLAGG